MATPINGPSATKSTSSEDKPITIHPTASEISNGRLTPQNLELAIRSLHNDGLVVIADLLPHSKLDHLNKKMMEDALLLQRRGDNMPFNYNKGNIQQDPPPVAEFFDEELFLNPIAIQITRTHLGPDPKWTFCSANTALPPSPTPNPPQPVHSDADFAHPTHPFALVLNIPLITMTPSNGSTALWLGTHLLNSPAAQLSTHGDRFSGAIDPAILEARRKKRGPIQPVVEKGSMIIRDLRLWHNGMPNLSTGEVRVMVALIHFAPWYRNRMVLGMGESVRGVLEQAERKRSGGLGLEVPVKWVPDEEVLGHGGYLERGFGNSYDFDQAP